MNLNINESDASQFEYPNVLTLNDATELPEFEDLVANDIYPYASEDRIAAWQGRVALRDLIRPPKFNGSLRNIEILSMEDPYDRLLDARERGWSITGGTLPRKDIDTAREGTRGFLFTADAHSSGKGIIGQIQSEMWYLRAPASRGSWFYVDTSTSSGSAVVRRVTKPKLERDRFVEADENAKKVGLQVLRKNMTNPFNGGLPRT